MERMLIKANLNVSPMLSVSADYFSIKELSHLELNLTRVDSTRLKNTVCYRLSIKTKSGCDLIFDEEVEFYPGEGELIQLVLDLNSVIEEQLASLWRVVDVDQNDFKYGDDKKRSIVVEVSDYLGLEMAVKSLGKKIVSSDSLDEPDGPSVRKASIWGKFGMK